MNFTFLYVAALYFAGIFIWRRFGTSIPWRNAIFFYLLVLLFLFRPLTQAYVNVPADYLFRLFPWRGMPSDLQNRNPEINDVILQMVPWAQQVRTSWRSGHVPLWNWSTGGGYPLLANGQSAALSPFRIAALPLGLGNGLTCEAALKLLVALTFTYLFTRRRRFSEAASIVSAVSFGFSTFIVVWLYFPHSAVVALVPALFLGLDLVIAAARPRRVIFLAGVLGAMVLSGHPESVAHSVLAGALYSLFALLHVARRTSATERRRAVLQRVVALAISGGLALLLAAPFILPFLEAMPRSQRYQWLHGAGSKLIRYELSYVTSMIHPEFYGLQRKENVWGPGIAEAVCGYGGVLGWIGWIALVLELMRRRKVTWFEAFHIVSLPLFIGIALGWYGFGDVFERLPLFSLAANGRLRLVVCWVVAVMAGMVVDQLRTRRGILVLATAIFAVAFALTFLTQRPESWYHVRDAWLTSIPRWIVVAAALASLTLIPRRAAHLLLLSVITFDLWMFGMNWNPVVDARQLYPPTPLIGLLRYDLDKRGELSRIAGTSAALFPNSAALYGFEDIRAHDPMANGRYLGALRVFAGYSSDQYFAFLKKLDTPYVDFLNVRYVITSPLEWFDPPWRMIYSGPDGRIFVNPRTVSRFFVPQNVQVEFEEHARLRAMIRDQDFAHTVYLERLPTSYSRPVQLQVMNAAHDSRPRAAISHLRRIDDGYSMIVDARQWSFIASSQPNFPGWKIYRNGSERIKPVETNENFIGFIVPPGRSAITVVYRPLSFTVGAWLAALAAAAMVVAYGLDSRRRAALATSALSRDNEADG